MNVRHFLSAASAGKKSCVTSKVHQDLKIIGMYYCANNMKNQGCGSKSESQSQQNLESRL